MQKRNIQKRFFKIIGPNAETFKALLESAQHLCFYMKDSQGRIMALNRRNCDVCNISNEEDAIGLKSSDIFPEKQANDYMSLDKEVLRTGKPVIGRVTQYPADKSTSFMISDVYPLRDKHGKIVGTARAYHLTADCKSVSAHYDRMRILSNYIESHYSENIRLQDLAKISGKSVSGLKRTFLETFNMSPGRYITTIRLNVVRKLLETTDKLISEIATETGFFDQSHLSRIFKKERGITPSEYRHRHRLLSRPSTC